MERKRKGRMDLFVVVEGMGVEAGSSSFAAAEEKEVVVGSWGSVAAEGKEVEGGSSDFAAEGKEGEGDSWSFAAAEEKEVAAGSWGFAAAGGKEVGGGSWSLTVGVASLVVVVVRTTGREGIVVGIMMRICGEPEVAVVVTGVVGVSTGVVIGDGVVPWNDGGLNVGGGGGAGGRNLDGFLHWVGVLPLVPPVVVPPSRLTRDPSSLSLARVRTGTHVGFELTPLLAVKPTFPLERCNSNNKRANVS